LYGISTTPPVPHQTPPKPKARFSEISGLVKSERLLELVSLAATSENPSSLVSLAAISES
jgi:hypothetical protein